MKTTARFLTFFILIGLVLSVFVITAAAETSEIGVNGSVYKPDYDGHWAQVYVQKWVNVGLLTGYPDGSYHLDDIITRAEFVTLVNKAFRQRSPGAGCDFKDVGADEWYYQDIATGTNLKYISGYPDGTFKPNKGLSREEFAAIAAKLLNLKWIESDVVGQFEDSDKISDWSRGLVNTVVYNGIMTGYPDGTFKAEGRITRGEAIVAFDKALTIVRGRLLPQIAEAKSIGGFDND